MIVYQLRAQGFREMTGDFAKIHSRNIFRTEEAAKMFIPQFLDNCCKSQHKCDFDVLLPDNIDIKILEIELQD